MPAPAGSSPSTQSVDTATETHEYGEPAYWDQRYRDDPRPFDWYQKYPALTPLFDLYLRRSHRLLLVGCGNSVLGESMVDDGYKDVVNIDISSVVIEAMQKKYANQPGFQYIEMDVRDMSAFESNFFDAVIDKGTFDALMCGHNAMQNATKMLQEVGRVLKGNGVFILITYGDPQCRLRLLRDANSWIIKLHIKEKIEIQSEDKTWELTTPLPLNEDGSSVSSVLGQKSEVHYIYVCIKEEPQPNDRN